ncbi:MAG TPA: gluconolaconase [Bryobacteraceae bacterium]|nr:gluconolaconase [Bryobacteraceae bacterium]
MARKTAEIVPNIQTLSPEAAIAGGEIRIHGKGFAIGAHPRVMLGDVTAPLIVGSDRYIVARVPEEAVENVVKIESGSKTSSEWICEIGIPIGDNLHPVANPAVDSTGIIFTTFSGSRGQKTPTSVFRVDPHEGPSPFLSEIMNATGLAFDANDTLYVSSRYDGIVYEVSPRGEMAVYVEGMGVATGITFDGEGNLYVGDRSGTIFKISRSRQIYVYATLEPSIAAYHLAFGPDGYLYVTGPTTSSFDCVQRVSNKGEVEVFYRGLGRPQGLAFDSDDNLYVAASLGGRRGVVRITQEREAALFLSGPGIVGLAFSPMGSAIVATTSMLYRVDCGLTPRAI